MRTTDALIVRPASEDDLPAILDLYAQTGMNGGVTMSADRARALFRRIAGYPDYGLYVVADRDGTVVATYALLIMDNIAHNGTPLSIVEQVCVATSAQGTGLGTLMMHHAMDVSRARGCYKLALSSNVKFERAHAFYDKLGFQRHGYSFVVDLK